MMRVCCVALRYLSDILITNRYGFGQNFNVGQILYDEIKESESERKNRKTNAGCAISFAKR